MSHYKNVSTLLELAESGDQVAIVELIQNSNAEVLADDICFLITSMWACISHHEKRRLHTKFLTDISNYEIKRLEDILDETD